jgi:hypothetical protein
MKIIIFWECLLLVANSAYFLPRRWNPLVFTGLEIYYLENVKEKA